MDLVSASSLPEPALARGGGRGISRLVLDTTPARALVMHPLGAAGKQHDESSQKQQDHSRKDSPNSNTPLRLTIAVTIVIDAIAHDAEEDEIAGHHYNGHNKCEG